MRAIIRVEEVQNTPTYRALVAKKEIIKIGFLEKRSQREIITNGLAVYNNIGKIPGNITGTNLQVLKDLIENDKINNMEVKYDTHNFKGEWITDRSFDMTSENLNHDKDE